MKNVWALITATAITTSAFGAAPAASLEDKLKKIEQKYAELRLVKYHPTALQAVNVLEEYLQTSNTLHEKKDPVSAKAQQDADVKLHNQLSEMSKTCFGYLTRYQNMEKKLLNKKMQAYKTAYETSQKEIQKLKQLLKTQTSVARTDEQEEYICVSPSALSSRGKKDQ